MKSKRAIKANIRSRPILHANLSFLMSESSPINRLLSHLYVISTVLGVIWLNRKAEMVSILIQAYFHCFCFWSLWLLMFFGKILFLCKELSSNRSMALRGSQRKIGRNKLNYRLTTLTYLIESFENPPDEESLLTSDININIKLHNTSNHLKKITH